MSENDEETKTYFINSLPGLVVQAKNSIEAVNELTKAFNCLMKYSLSCGNIRYIDFDLTEDDEKRKS